MKRQTHFTGAAFLTLSLFLLMSLMSSCDNKQASVQPKTWEETWVVASKRVYAEGEGIYLCYWIKRNDSVVWELQYYQVSGFEYEEGYEYTITVIVTEVLDPPADASNRDYSLKEVLSKVKKDSDVPTLSDRKYDISYFPEVAYPNMDFIAVDSLRELGVMQHDTLLVMQGDILLADGQISGVDTKSGCIKIRSRYWPNNKVYYTYADDFTYQSKVQRAIAEWESKTSLTFINGTGIGDYIEFFHGEGNYSYIGCIGGKQAISLAVGGSTYGTAIHEIGHAVGLIHEHCRSDRDSYITVHTENIIDTCKQNFTKYTAATSVNIGAFDFESVMLYGSFAFSDNEEATMTTKSGLYFDGQRTHLSDGDVEGIKAIYGPPYHTIYTETKVTANEVSGTYENYECTVDYYVKIYEDLDGKTPTSLTYDRDLTVYKYHQVYDPDTGKTTETSTSWDITLSAGTSSYFLGRAYNVQRYVMSNPDELDVTTYSVVPYRTDLN